MLLATSSPALSDTSPNISTIFSGYTNPGGHNDANRGLDCVLMDIIMGHIPLPALWSLRLASKFWYRTVRGYLRRKHTRLFRKYISQYDDFRALMRRSGTIVSGSEALDFVLHGTSCPPVRARDMDIYANPLYALSIVLHLRDVEGYHVVVERRLSGLSELIDDYGAGVVSVTTLVNVGRGTKLQVVCVARLSAVHQISLFWSTLVMNFLTADGFSMAYPALTLRGIGLVSSISHSGISKSACIAKYIDRGFAIVGFEGNAPPPEDPLSTHPSLQISNDWGHPTEMAKWNCPDIIRCWTDDGCLRMTFADKGCGGPWWTKPFTSWLFGGQACGGGCEPDSEPVLWVRGEIVA